MKANVVFLFIFLSFCFVCFGFAGETISKKAADHIQERHWYNAKAAGKTSRFNKNMTIKKLNSIVLKTLRRGTRLKSKTGDGTYTHEYTFNRPIGVATNGKKAKTLLVVTNPEGEVITAFPSK